MDKDWHILVFSIIYLFCFPFIYTLLFHDFKGYILFLLIWMTINIPSLLIVFSLLIYEYSKTKKVPKYVYHLLTVVLTSILFLYFINSEGDPKNIYPIFKENQCLLILLGIASHLIALSSIQFIKK